MAVWPSQASALSTAGGNTNREFLSSFLSFLKSSFLSSWDRSIRRRFIDDERVIHGARTRETRLKIPKPDGSFVIFFLCILGRRFLCNRWETLINTFHPVDKAVELWKLVFNVTTLFLSQCYFYTSEREREKEISVMLYTLAAFIIQHTPSSWSYINRFSVRGNWIPRSAEQRNV